LFGLDALLV